MSYDLYFRATKPLDLVEVRAFFEERGYKVSETQAFFENESTGVYFGFELGSTVSFNINYYRPHVFGLEAATELTSFIERFGLEIEDPQMHGMGKGPYTADGFLRGWNAGNEFAHSAIASNEGVERPLALPAVRNAAVWRWNYAKDAIVDELEANLGDVPPCFVPTVMMVVPEGGSDVKTIVVWDVQMAIAIPEVDLVVTHDDRGLWAADRAAVLAAVTIDTTWEADRVLASGRVLGLRACLIDELDELAHKRVRTLMKPFKATRVAADQVLDAELVNKAFS
ncbi:MAG: hypothetical protein JO257_18975 [Deltaproteobacteria bacterium]|nr:hypothetical protein [Deltaproteobacteria bacterium]